ncbi:metallophosphoesterase family protein [Pseudoduganella ginsengisoli]|uniref:Metallophosphoesterase n=1 Tax=Pseudoduganella ginsengisoli TaxID=1462440 RepID=A0A6L6Q3K8_9BURK|nr:metallophosphoesterase family protein [Pseudoduganella ginsengisoli]MTW04185.1 metallophosphoesterase [Pseudoduganella ginsengisoli]
MRLLILSDLHLEIRRGQPLGIDLARSRPDAVVLAGDIDTGANAVPWAAQTFAGLPVLYVAGNHEAYGHELYAVERALRDACAATGNVHFLNCDQYVTGGVRFLGATLWTDFALFGEPEKNAAMRQAENVMTDYRRISVATGEKPESRLLQAADTAQLHTAHKAWLQTRLAQAFDGKTVVITHMAPSIRSVAAKYATDLTSAAFASPLDSLAEKPDLWIHGHMHDSYDYPVGNGRVICNPCGYLLRGGANENAAFDAGLVVDL